MSAADLISIVPGDLEPHGLSTADQRGSSPPATSIDLKVRLKTPKIVILSERQRAKNLSFD